MTTAALEQRLRAIADELDTARRSLGDRGEVVLDGRASYREGEPVQVHVRKRAHRYELGDLARAADLAGKPNGWLEVAQDVVDQHTLNVNRRGTVFVPAIEGRDLARLALRVADASVEVYAALLELSESSDSPRRSR